MVRTRFHQFAVIIFIGFLGFTIATAGISWMLIFKKSTVSKLPQYSLAAVTEDCKKSVQSDDFGRAEIKDSLIVRDQTATFAVPCKVQLAAGVRLELINTNLTTKNLFITNLDPESYTEFVLEDSTLTGSESGLQISLQGRNSQLTIRRGTFDYPLSIGLAVGANDDDNQAGLFITGSRFRSTGGSSEGIVLASTGKAEVTSNEFISADPDRAAFLLAAECLQNNNRGINPACQAE